ncbi:MAG TPA: DUF2269 domain-containing protein [Xanthobacteraceae bacterium]|nr:DUF2269 domain-containing protein [Xanthobacteraceae bacterium]
MIDLLLALRLLHILAAAVLFGTGLGIAFFMLMAHRTRDAALIAQTGRIVVIADVLFTATAVVIQPLTGLWQARLIGFSLTEPWLAISLGLYGLVGACWLPAVWIQTRLRGLATAAARDGSALPPQYHRLFRLWFVLGWPAFAGVLAIFALMVWKPATW